MFALSFHLLIKLVYSQGDILDKAMEIHAARVNEVSEMETLLWTTSIDMHIVAI